MTTLTDGMAVIARAGVTGSLLWLLLGVSVVGIVAAGLPGGLAVAAAFVLGLLGNIRAPQRFGGRLSERQWLCVGIGLASCFAILGYMWIAAFSSMQGSDFGVYYRCGLKHFDSIGGQIDSCQSAYMKPTLIFWERSLLYTTPLGLLVGSRPGAVEVLNASLHAVTLFVLLFVTTRAMSARSGAVAVALWGMFPERIYSLTLATPDNMAGVLIPLAFGLVASKRRSLAGRTLLLAAFILAANLLRSVGPFVWAAAFVGVLGSDGEYRGRRAFRVLVAGLAALAAQSILYSALPRSYGSASPLKMISALDLTTNQNWNVARRWVDHIWPAIHEIDRTTVAISSLRREVSHNLWRYPGYVGRKAAALAAGVGYSTLATSDLRDNRDTELTVGKSNAPLASHASVSHRAVTCLLLGMALATCLQYRLYGMTLVAGAFVAATFTTMLLATETQPRYLFLPGLALAILASAPWTPPPSVRHSRAESLLGAVGVLIVTCGLAIAAFVTKDGAPAALKHASIVSFRGCADDGPGLLLGAQWVRVQMPSGVPCAAVQVPLPSSPRPLGFAIVKYPLPFPSDPARPSHLSWVIIGPDGDQIEGELGLATARWYRVNGRTSGYRPFLTILFKKREIDQPAEVDISHLGWVG